MRTDSRRRRTAKESTENRCPICQQVFPSACNMDAYDYEEMVLKHVTNCSSSSTTASTPSRRGRKKNNTFSSTVGKGVVPIVSPPSVCTPSPTNALIDSSPLPQYLEKRQYSIVSNDSSSSASARKEKVLSAEDMDEISTHFAAVEYNQYLLSPNSASSVNRQQMEDDAPALAQCPICFVHFKKEANYKMVIAHVNRCSREVTVLPENPISASDVGFVAAVKQISPTKAAAAVTNSSSSSSSQCIEDPIVKKSNQKKITATNNQQLSNKKSGAKIVKKPLKEKIAPPLVKAMKDPRHFLNQKWWRKPTANVRKPRGQKGGSSPNAKRASVVKECEFSIQQCLVEDNTISKNSSSKDNHDEYVGRTRESKRRKRMALGSDTLALKCPICGERFGPSTSIGSLTEEDMSRHVRKCSRQLFGKKALWRKPDRHKKKDKTPLVFTEEEKCQLQNALQGRVSSLNGILQVDEKIKICPLNVSFLQQSHDDFW